MPQKRSSSQKTFSLSKKSKRKKDSDPALETGIVNLITRSIQNIVPIPMEDIEALKEDISESSKKEFLSQGEIDYLIKKIETGYKNIEIVIQDKISDPQRFIKVMEGTIKDPELLKLGLEAQQLRKDLLALQGVLQERRRKIEILTSGAFKNNVSDLMRKYLKGNDYDSFIDKFTEIANYISQNVINGKNISLDDLFTPVKELISYFKLPNEVAVQVYRVLLCSEGSRDLIEF